MKQFFAKYYLRWFVLFSLLAGWLFLMILVSTLIKFKGSEVFIQLGKGVLVCAAGLIVFSFLFGGYFYFWYEYVWPRRRLKILKGQELGQLESLQFQRDDKEVCYGGMYKDYYMVVSPSPVHNEGCNFILCAFIAPVKENIADLENLDEGFRLMLLEPSICIERVLSPADKTVPSFQQLTNEMDKVIAYLKLKDIKPAQVEIEEITNR
jgi:hypothetical protein